MSEAKEYLKKVGLIQSPYISQERVISHLEAFAEEQGKKQLKLCGVGVQSEQFICPCCKSDKTYKTEAYHCSRCAVTTEV